MTAPAAGVWLTTAIPATCFPCFCEPTYHGRIGGLEALTAQALALVSRITVANMTSCGALVAPVAQLLVLVLSRHKLGARSRLTVAIRPGVHDDVHCWFSVGLCHRGVMKADFRYSVKVFQALRWSPAPKAFGVDAGLGRRDAQKIAPGAMPGRGGISDSSV